MDILCEYISYTIFHRICQLQLMDEYNRAINNKFKYYNIITEKILQRYKWNIPIYEKRYNKIDIYIYYGSYNRAFYIKKNAFSYWINKCKLSVYPDAFYYNLYNIECTFTPDKFTIVINNNMIFDNMGMFHIHKIRNSDIYKNTQQIMYMIREYNLYIYYRSGELFCNIEYNRGFNGIKDSTIFYYQTGIILCRYDKK